MATEGKLTKEGYQTALANIESLRELMRGAQTKEEKDMYRSAIQDAAKDAHLELTADLQITEESKEQVEKQTFSAFSFAEAEGSGWDCSSAST